MHACKPAAVRNTVKDAITGSHLAQNSPVDSSRLFLHKADFFFLNKKKHPDIKNNPTGEGKTRKQNGATSPSLASQPQGGSIVEQLQPASDKLLPWSLDQFFTQQCHWADSSYSFPPSLHKGKTGKQYKREGAIPHVVLMDTARMQGCQELDLECDCLYASSLGRGLEMR